MITPPPAPEQPEISLLDWAGDPQQCPKWVGFPTRAGLPAGLIWSGRDEVPGIGTRVHIYLNGIGPAEVKAYFHAEGYLGVLCQPDQMPEHLRKHGVTLGHFFGRELEPHSPGPAAPAMVAEVVAIEPTADPVGPAQEQYRLCVAREEEDRRYYQSKQREAKQAFPHDQKKQGQHCQDALQVVELATQRTQQARQALTTAEQLHQDGLAQAGEANGNDPGINRATDWIPDYPPQGGPDDPAGDDYDPRDDDDYRDYDRDNPNPEAEALGDLHGSRFD